VELIMWSLSPYKMFIALVLKTTHRRAHIFKGSNMFAACDKWLQDRDIYVRIHLLCIQQAFC